MYSRRNWFRSNRVRSQTLYRSHLKNRTPNASNPHSSLATRTTKFRPSPFPISLWIRIDRPRLRPCLYRHSPPMQNLTKSKVSHSNGPITKHTKWIRLDRRWTPSTTWPALKTITNHSTTLPMGKCRLHGSHGSRWSISGRCDRATLWWWFMRSLSSWPIVAVIRQAVPTNKSFLRLDFSL